MQPNNVAEFAPSVVLLMWGRAFGSCERCGRGLRWAGRGYSWSAHHRQPRGMGGSGDAALGRASNGLILCGHGTDGCHGEVESDRQTAVAAGFIVPMGEHPIDVSVTLYTFGLCKLRDDGNIENP